jgi:hypothetical protein
MNKFSTRLLFVCLGLALPLGAVSAEPMIGPGSSSGTDIDLKAFEAATNAHDTTAVLHAFGKLDSDADGKLTRGEARADSSLTRSFRSLDRNRDGNLSPEEYAAR